MNSRRPSSVVCAARVISSATAINSPNRHSRGCFFSVARIAVLDCTTALALDISESIASVQQTSLVKLRGLPQPTCHCYSMKYQHIAGFVLLGVIYGCRRRIRRRSGIFVCLLCAFSRRIVVAFAPCVCSIASSSQ